MEYKLGWDCHGLPIELKALQSIASDDKVTDPVHVRQLSRKFASDTIKQQKKAMSQWGIMCDISFLNIPSLIRFLHSTWKIRTKRAATTLSRRTTN